MSTSLVSFLFFIILFQLCLFKAIREKNLGNEAYKKKDFTTAYQHYDKAIELDPSNITFLNNKAGKIEKIRSKIFNICYQIYNLCYLYQNFLILSFYF